MVMLPGFEVMPFKVTEVIMPVIAFPGQEGHEQLVPEMILNIMIVRTLFPYGI